MHPLAPPPRCQLPAAPPPPADNPPTTGGTSLRTVPLREIYLQYFYEIKEKHDDKRFERTWEKGWGVLVSHVDTFAEEDAMQNRAMFARTMPFINRWFTGIITSVLILRSGASGEITPATTPTWPGSRLHTYLSISAWIATTVSVPVHCFSWFQSGLDTIRCPFSSAIWWMCLEIPLWKYLKHCTSDHRKRSSP